MLGTSVKVNVNPFTTGGWLKKALVGVTPNPVVPVYSAIIAVAPLNIKLSVVTLGSVIQDRMFWMNTSVLLNIKPIVVTLEVSQAPIFWLNTGEL